MSYALSATVTGQMVTPCPLSPHSSTRLTAGEQQPQTFEQGAWVLLTKQSKPHWFSERPMRKPAVLSRQAQRTSSDWTQRISLSTQELCECLHRNPLSRLTLPGSHKVGDDGPICVLLRPIKEEAALRITGANGSREDPLLGVTNPSKLQHDDRVL